LSWIDAFCSMTKLKAKAFLTKKKKKRKEYVVLESRGNEISVAAKATRRSISYKIF
jgi:hypothetical protein